MCRVHTKLCINIPTILYFYRQNDVDVIWSVLIDSRFVIIYLIFNYFVI